MANIWEFLLQTFTVSLTAGLVLIMKALLKDKLSPRWQYGIWSILALRILIPVSAGKDVMLPITLWVEIWKGNIEKTMQSVYSAVYVPVSLESPLPFINIIPNSLTDWIFVVYVVGVILYLFRYLFSYLKLRILLRQGVAVSSETEANIHYVCEKYHLKPCRTVAIHGLSSAFVCGVFCPVLVVPAKQEIDEKILLHELLHLKYCDILQGMFWCILKSLHWCNPFLQYVFRRIENDMESLCDQRVLERLEGEERREYGVILLNMVNERYARVPGTSSISNGGKNISRRIEAIVRFKKYPRGMALVSVCIAIVLASPVLRGTAAEEVYLLPSYAPIEIEKLDEAMAMARLYRCTTVAAALDTYAKGLYQENGVYIATVSSLSKHEEMEKRMQGNVKESKVVFQWDSGAELENIVSGNGYAIYNLQGLEDDSYKADMVFHTYRWDEGANAIGSVLIPVVVRYEDAWIVEECGKRQVYNHMVDESSISPMLEWKAAGETGTVTVRVTSIHSMKDGGDTNKEFYQTMFGESLYMEFHHTSPMEGELNLDAEFETAWVYNDVIYDSNTKTLKESPRCYVGMQVMPLNSLDEEKGFPKEDFVISSGGSSSDGYHWTNQNIEEWDGTIFSGGGTAYAVDGAEIEENTIPAAYKVRIIWDDVTMEEFLLTEVKR